MLNNDKGWTNTCCNIKPRAFKEIADDILKIKWYEQCDLSPQANKHYEMY